MLVFFDAFQQLQTYPTNTSSQNKCELMRNVISVHSRRSVSATMFERLPIFS